MLHELSLHTTAVRSASWPVSSRRFPADCWCASGFRANCSSRSTVVSVALVSTIILRLVLLVSELAISIIVYLAGWRRTPACPTSQPKRGTTRRSRPSRQPWCNQTAASLDVNCRFTRSLDFAIVRELQMIRCHSRLQRARKPGAIARRARRRARANGYEMEIIFVDDGSTDGSWSEIERLAQRDDPRAAASAFAATSARPPRFRAGFKAGQRRTRHDAGRRPAGRPARDSPLPGAWPKNLDVVSGWKQVRHDPWHKVCPSRVFNWLVGWLTGVRLHDHNCGMKCYRREVLDEVRLYGELHRFVPVLAAARGFSVGEIAIHHRPREFGRSKYGARRMVKRLSRPADRQVPHRLSASGRNTCWAPSG